MAVSVFSRRHKARSQAAAKRAAAGHAISSRSVEALQPRRLLSGSLNVTDVNPPLTQGTSWTYQYSGGLTGTVVQTVGKSVLFNGFNATEIDSTNVLTAPFASSQPSSTYEAFTSAGLVDYGTVVPSDGSDNTQTTTISPALIDFPATLTVGVPVQQTVEEAISYSDGDTPAPSALTSTYTLQSLTTTPIGSYNAYEIDSSSTINSVTSTAQEWYAPHVGLVKVTFGTGTGQFSELLTAFTGDTGSTGTSGSGTLTPTLKGSLPASIIATSPLKLNNALSVTATSAVSGNVSEAIYLSPDTSAADSVFTLATGHGSLKLASGKSKTLTLKYAKSIPASIPAGTYNVLVVATDSAGTVQDTLSKQLTIVAPTVDITGAVTKAPTTAKAGKKVPLTFNISNASAATIAAVGTVKIEFASSPDGLISDATPLTSTTAHVNLKPGKSTKVTFSLALTKTGFVIVDLDPGNTVFKSDTNPANNIFATATAITVS